MPPLRWRLQFWESCTGGLHCDFNPKHGCILHHCHWSGFCWDSIHRWELISVLPLIPLLKASSFGSLSLRITISLSLPNFFTPFSLTSTSGASKNPDQKFFHCQWIIDMLFQITGSLRTFSGCAVPQAPPCHLPWQPWVQVVHPAAGWGEPYLQKPFHLVGFTHVYIHVIGEQPWGDGSESNHCQL